jgi:hypothetical protein
MIADLTANAIQKLNSIFFAADGQVKFCNLAVANEDGFAK